MPMPPLDLCQRGGETSSGGRGDRAAIARRQSHVSDLNAGDRLVSAPRGETRRSVPCRLNIYRAPHEMGKSPSTSPYLAAAAASTRSRPPSIRSTASRPSSCFSELDMDDDAVARASGWYGRMADARRLAKGWSGKVVAKVEENAGLCLIALSQGLVSAEGCA
jgi:hypothetical protein